MTQLVLGFQAAESDRPTAKPSASLQSFLTAMLARIGNSAYRAQQKRAESDAARFIQENGGLLTDDIERQLSRRFGGIVGN